MNKKISILVILTFLSVAVDNNAIPKKEEKPKVKCRECIEENYKRKMPPLKDNWKY